MMEVQRTVKSTLFAMLFSDKVKLLRLYNAVNKTHYTNEEDLEITTLENAIYVNMKNDISFVFGSELSLYEHQSTVNANMPLRDLLYVSCVIQNLVANCNLYGRKLVKIPTPRFMVFYNGTEKQPARREMYLSDAFEKYMEKPELELKVTVININAGDDDGILQECRELWEYSQFVTIMRRFAENMPIEEAVNKAVDECICQGILADFLEKNKAEAVKVSIFEFDQEKYDAGLREEGYEDGEFKAKSAIAIKLHKMNMPMEQIAEVVGLSLEYIQEILMNVETDGCPK